MQTIQSDAVFDLSETYVQLRPAYSSKLWKAEEFWPAVHSGQIENSGFGLLVSTYFFDKDWTTWEVHPTGDEIVYLIEGEIDLILEMDGFERRIRLEQLKATVIPKGIWHRAIVHRPSSALHITPGDGTQNRALSANK